VASGFAVIAVVSWLVYLLLQSGQLWDETEHAHVAWLISQGKRPLVDFFQHHQPLLWNLLTPYFRLGFGGAGVLLWGRVLVVCSALAAIISLHRLGHWAGAAVFIGLTLLLPELFVTRPETISAALFLVALAIWACGRRGARPVPDILSALAGVAVGAALYASPRFILLGGFFLLMGQHSVRRWIFLCSGAVAFVGLYTVCAGYPLSVVLFNIQFSAHLQHVGHLSYGKPVEFWMLLMMCACAPLAALIMAVARPQRLRSAVFVAYLVVVFVLCNYLAGLFGYSQAYAPFVVAVAITAAWITQRVELPADATGTLALIGAAAVLISGIGALQPWMKLQPLNLLSLIKARDKLGARIPPHEAVLVYPPQSPIAAPDVSYYGSPLLDGQDRLCTAVRTFKTTLRLPACDFLAELVKRPYLTEVGIRMAMRFADVDKATTILLSEYEPLTLDGPLGRVAVRRPSTPMEQAAVHLP
jgi:hypothetical protein